MTVNWSVVSAEWSGKDCIYTNSALPNHADKDRLRIGCTFSVHPESKSTHLQRASCRDKHTNIHNTPRKRKREREIAKSAAHIFQYCVPDSGCDVVHFQILLFSWRCHRFTPFVLLFFFFLCSSSSSFFSFSKQLTQTLQMDYNVCVCAPLCMQNAFLSWNRARAMAIAFLPFQ